jgi:DNA ligase-1
MLFNKYDFKPMLAAPVTDIELLQYPVLASPKLDGIRCVVIDGVAYSRSLKPIPNETVQKFFADGKYDGFDGELIAGPHNAQNVFNRSTRFVMKRDAVDDWAFYVFDWIQGGITIERMGLVESLEWSPHVRPVIQTTIGNVEALREYERVSLSQGFEGVMIRSIGGEYKHGRSTLKEGLLLKLKRFADDEALVIGVECLMRNGNAVETNALGYTERSSAADGLIPMDALGALIVRRADGVEFKVGSGFTETQRYDFWLRQDEIIGKIITYKHFEVGAKDKPRFPIFKGFRDEKDISK